MGPTPLHVNPIFEIGPMEPRFSEWLVFEGISVDESGQQHYLDASVAYKRAVLNAIDYLSKFGYSKEQVIKISPWKSSCNRRLSGIDNINIQESKEIWVIMNIMLVLSGLSFTFVLSLRRKDFRNCWCSQCCCHPCHSNCYFWPGTRSSQGSIIINLRVATYKSNRGDPHLVIPISEIAISSGVLGC